MIESPVNGSVADAPHFPEWTLRKLARLHARAQGAQEVAEVVTQVARTAGQRFQEALAEACEELGQPLPDAQGNVQIDWRTGAFHFEPETAPAPPERIATS